MALRLLAFAALSLPMTVHCEIIKEVRCFNSNQAGLKDFGLYALYDKVTKWSGAYIKYRGANSTITLVLKNRTEEALDPDMPYQTITSWYEVHQGEITGEYEKLSQGAMIYSVIYTNYKTRKHVNFSMNYNNTPNGEECVWEAEQK
jgi:hypothetical protein